jgi:hypothetical protein
MLVHEAIWESCRTGRLVPIETVHQRLHETPSSF